MARECTASAYPAAVGRGATLKRAMFDVKCPACGEVYHVSEEHVGKSLRCRRCGNVFSVTAAQAAPGPSPATASQVASRPAAAPSPAGAQSAAAPGAAAPANP